MAMTIIDGDQLKIGQVKTITSDFGKTVDYTELLFSPTTKAEFQPNDGNTGIIFSVSDSSFDLPEIVCELSRETLRNLIIALKNMYNELSDTPPTEAVTAETKIRPAAVKSCCTKNIL